MINILLSCSGVPAPVGEEAAHDIAQEFREHRPWYANVSCRWDGSRLLLSADSDVDQDGSALCDEFSDCLAAYIAAPFAGRIRVESVTDTGSV